MIVRKLNETEGQGRKVAASGWESNRLILKEDAVGFSFHITVIKKNAVLYIQYKNHFEAVYCISGRGEIIDLGNQRAYSIEPGTLYLLDKHDKHQLKAFDEMQLACVFNPPLKGDEVHDASGSYPALSELV
jgi:L-ectoine synthase